MVWSFGSDCVVSDESAPLLILVRKQRKESETEKTNLNIKWAWCKAFKSHFCPAVLYAPDIVGQGLDMTKKCLIEEVYSRTHSGKDLDAATPWYPEVVGYAVCLIEQGICILEL